jgi:prepilin-type N-terminal cleavage/methylation domain-containing protein
VLVTREDGFTLVELLVTITIGLLTMAGAMTLLTGSMRRSDDAQRRADAMQRARVAMDTLTRDLRAQTCVGNATPIVSGNASSVTFYADYFTSTTRVAGAVPNPHRRVLALDAAGVLTETIYPGTDATGSPVTRRLGTRFAGAGTSGALFEYFAFSKTTGKPDTPIAAINATTAPTVARIVVSLEADPTGTQDGRRSTTLTSDVFVRSVDPDGSPVPVCA